MLVEVGSEFILDPLVVFDTIQVSRLDNRVFRLRLLFMFIGFVHFFSSFLNFILSFVGAQFNRKQVVAFEALEHSVHLVVVLCIHSLWYECLFQKVGTFFVSPDLKRLVKCD